MEKAYIIDQVLEGEDTGIGIGEIMLPGSARKYSFIGLNVFSVNSVADNALSLDIATNGSRHNNVDNDIYPKPVGDVPIYGLDNSLIFRLEKIGDKVLVRIQSKNSFLGHPVFVSTAEITVEKNYDCYKTFMNHYLKDKFFIFILQLNCQNTGILQLYYRDIEIFDHMQ